MRFFRKNNFVKKCIPTLESSAEYEKSLMYKKSDLKLSQYKRV